LRIRHPGNVFNVARDLAPPGSFGRPELKSSGSHSVSVIGRFGWAR
jgi:hypothetical protein